MSKQTNGRLYLRILLLILLAIGVVVFNPMGTEAAEVLLVGNQSGVKISYPEGSFNLKGIFPSKEYRQEFSSQVTINNNGANNSNLSFRFENLSEKGNLLYKVLLLRVTSDGVEIWEGKLEQINDDFNFGIIASGKEKKYDFQFRLPEGLGNEYQNQKLDFKLIFTAGQALYYLVNVGVSPVDGGTVSRGGSYAPGDTVTLEAQANSGYHFTGWFEGGGKVFDGFIYTFTADRDRNLVARFEKAGQDDDNPGDDGGGDYSGGNGEDEEQGDNTPRETEENTEPPKDIDENDINNPSEKNDTFPTVDADFFDETKMVKEQPKMPKTGGIPPLLFMGLGLGLVLIGWGLKGNKGKK